MYLKLNKLNRVFWMALGVLLLTNWSKDEPEALRIHEELEVYFNNFVNEASARGIVVDWESNPIEGFLQEIPGATVAGQCTYNEESPNRIVVDITTWNRSSDLDREYIVFHELGHDVYRRAYTKMACFIS